MSYEQFGVNFYRNSANPSGAFEHPGELGEEAYKRLKKDLKENYTGLKNTGNPLLLEGGMKWAQMTINPIDAQLIESKNFQIEDICRIYRVPQHLVQKLDRSTFSNIEHQSLEFVMYTMLPIFKRYEDNINMQLLTPDERKQGYYIEAKIDGLLRGDTKTRAEAYAIGRQWGYLSVNDIRKLENLPPIDNGNIYLQPSNMMEAGKESQSVQAYAKLVEDIYRMIDERR
jgi:HK97 family phage portal protein